MFHRLPFFHMAIRFLSCSQDRAEHATVLALVEYARRVEFVGLYHAVAFIAGSLTGTGTGCEIVAFH